MQQFHKEVGLVSERARFNFRAKESLSCEIQAFFIYLYIFSSLKSNFTFPLVGRYGERMLTYNLYCFCSSNSVGRYS
nr:MAG TPA: hypothetical protein [Caudoviricetes sp.]